MALLLLAGLVLRLPDLDRPSIEQRENQSSILARGYYLGSGEHLPADLRRVLDEVDTVLEPFEPPLLELAAAGLYRLGDAERIWIPRLLSVLAWIAGGAFLALVARRFLAHIGVLAAVGLYVVWPYAFWHSRKFMPDALLVACLLGAVLAIVRFWESPTRGRFAVAGAAAAIATAIKPGVGLFFVIALYAAAALERRKLRDELRSGRLPLFAGVSASLAVLYVAIGRYATGFVNPDAAAERIAPDLVLTAGFWRGWWEMVSFLLRWPQPQEVLAVLAIGIGFLGLAVARGTARTILWGLTAGYAAFALAFASYTATHPYYALPVIPIIALAAGVVITALDVRLRATPVARAGLVALVALVVAGGGYKAYGATRGPAPLERIADYRAIGALTDHTTRAIVVDGNLAHPVMYWGWIVGQNWELDYNESLPAWIDPHQKDYLIVVGNDQLDHPGLRAFVRNRAVVARTERYTVYDLRA